MDNVLDFEQGSHEWHMARCASIGATSIEGLMANLELDPNKEQKKKPESAGRRNLQARLVRESLTGKPTETYQTAAMLRGTELEPQARKVYAFEHCATVRQVGLVLHPTIKGAHASPDGLVGDDGLVQIKCPEDAAFLDILEGKKISRGYWLQVLFEMACTDREWCDFAAFHPDFPPEMHLQVRRIERDDYVIGRIEQEVKKILYEVETMVRALRAEYSIPEAA